MIERITSPFVTFVLPAYNESKMIENTLVSLNANFENTGLLYEIVVVDDGSVDDTRSKVMVFGQTNGNVNVISYGKNVGKGFAIKIGFRKAKGAAIIFLDSDSDIDTRQVKRFLDSLRTADIVIGSKRHPNSIVSVPLIRRLFSSSFNFLVQLLTGIRVGDTQTGIKAIKREAFLEIFDQLCVKRYAYDVELLVLAKIYGLKVSEVPVNLCINENFSLKESWHMLIDLLGITYRLRIRKWYQRGAPQHTNF